jgi:hypothetical protein
MSPKIFTSLSTSMQIEYLINYAEAIAELEEDGRYLSLFVYNSFFVRTTLDIATDQIIDISVVENAAELYSYVSDLNIEGLQLS